MSVQVIMRDGQPEYAVLPWDEYQALLRKPAPVAASVPPVEAALPALSQLTALREARNMTLEQLAQAVGISAAYLQMMEQGERQPGGPTRRSLAHVLEVPGWSDPE